jgi:predicted transcriptional regulator YdeE
MENLEPLRYERGRLMLLGGSRCQYAFANSARGIAEQWQQFHAIGQIPAQLGAKRYGVMCGENPGGFEDMCGVEVESFAQLPVSLGRMRIAEQQYAIFAHRGHASTIQETWNRIRNDWLPGSGYQSAHKPDFEVYDQQYEAVVGDGFIEIWLSISDVARLKI